MILPKNLFGEGMRIGLVIPGKVQIDIRNFVTFKPKEGFKWNILPISAHDGSTFRARFIRQIKTGFDFFTFNKFIMMTLWANIMWL